MKILQKIALGAAAMTASFGAFATTPTNALELANSISFADALALILVLAGLLMSFIGAKKGIEFVVNWWNRQRV